MLLFDLDGTLIDSSDIWVQIDIDFTTRHNLPLTKEYHDFVAHATAPASAAFTKEYYQLDMSIDAIMQEWSDQALYAYSNTIQLKPHVRTYLDQCQNNGERMVILTSSIPELCRAALEHNGLMQYFDQLLFAQEFGIEKKDPALFHTVARHLSVPIETCLLYDDSPISCRSAKAAGAKVVGVHDKFFAANEKEMRTFCDHYIFDFSELIQS